MIGCSLVFSLVKGQENVRLFYLDVVWLSCFLVNKQHVAGISVLIRCTDTSKTSITIFAGQSI